MRTKIHACSRFQDWGLFQMFVYKNIVKSLAMSESVLISIDKRSQQLNVVFGM